MIRHEPYERPNIRLCVVLTKTYSEETAHEIDEEVKTILKEAYEKAKSLLTSKRAVIEKIPKILLEKEVLEVDELRKTI